jgi:hypothetical protein
MSERDGISGPVGLQETTPVSHDVESWLAEHKIRVVGKEEGRVRLAGPAKLERSLRGVQ